MPLISQKALSRFLQISSDNSKNILIGTAPYSLSNSKYVSPIALSGLNRDNYLSYMDSGLPILNISVVDSLDMAFDEIKYTECGISAGLFTKYAKVI